MCFFQVEDYAQIRSELGWKEIEKQNNNQLLEPKSENSRSVNYVYANQQCCFARSCRSICSRKTCQQKIKSYTHYTKCMQSPAKIQSQPLDLRSFLRHWTEHKEPCVCTRKCPSFFLFSTNIMYFKFSCECQIFRSIIRWWFIDNTNTRRCIFVSLSLSFSCHYRCQQLYSCLFLSGHDSYKSWWFLVIIIRIEISGETSSLPTQSNRTFNCSNIVKMANLLVGIMGDWFLLLTLNCRNIHS